MMSQPAARIARETEASPGLALHFRALSIDGKRRAFRLEEVFWSALNILAAHNGRTLRSEMAAMLRKTSDAANASATLRANAVAELLGLWEAERAKAAEPDWRRILMAMPCPAFALSRNGDVVGVNDPMWRLLEDRGLPKEAGAALSVELPPAATARRPGEANQPRVCNAIFKAANRTTVCRVRIVLNTDEQGRQQLLIGFLETL